MFALRERPFSRPPRAFAVYKTHSASRKLQEGVQCLLEASCSNKNHHHPICINSSSGIKHDSNQIPSTDDEKLQAGFLYNKKTAHRIASKYPSQNATKGKTAASSLKTSFSFSTSSSTSSSTRISQYLAILIIFYIFFFTTFIPHFCSAASSSSSSLATVDSDSPEKDTNNILPFDLNSNPLKQPSTHFSLPNSYSSGGSNIDNNNNDNFEIEPSEIVIFHRWIRPSPPSNDFKFIENSRRDEHFMIDQTFNSTNSIHFQCKAFLHSYFSSSTSSDINETIILPVSWISDDGKILSNTDLLEINEKPNNDLKFRCKADLKDLDSMIDGSLLSRSIYFSNKPYYSIKIKPEKVHTVPGSVVRFVCHWPINSDATEILWKHNGTILKPSKLIKIGTIHGKSVLHILSANFEHSGNYKCVIKDSENDESETSNLIINESGKFSQGIELPSSLSAPINGKMIFECLLPGTQGVRWILERRSYEKKGETLPRIESKVLGNGTILILKNISTKHNGDIKCLVEVANNTLITKETEFKVFNESYNYEAAVFTPIERKQGTPVSFRCETYDILGESPEMAQWSLNGKPIERTPNVKVTRSTDYGIGHSDLIIAIAEAENEGLYTCIISNDQHERVHQLLLQVDVTTNETITNLKVSTDHKASCIHLDFDLPPSTDLAWAHFTPFFVVVHEQNSTKSLNSLPLMAKCNKRLHCKMEICQASGMLDDATDYVFRISMVLSGSGTVITQLSEPAFATTWDAQATKSVPLIISYNETENSITVEWEMPTDIKGKVENFALQIINYSEKMSNLFSNMNRLYFERPPEDRKYQIRNISDPFAYKIRVTPITRKPKLPVAQMQLLEYFPFFLITSEHAMASVDPEMPIPEFQLSQIRRDPTINISWTLPNDDAEVSKIVIKYQHVAVTQAKFISIERPVSDKFTELNKGIEVGLVYQICAAFIRKSDLSQSSWNCQTIPLKNIFNNLIYNTLKDAWNQKQLPPAVICDNGNCRCLPSKVIEGGMRVEWNKPESRAPSDLDDLSLHQVPEIQYIVHYTFNETDPASKEYEFPANEGDLFAELPPLLPNTTYRIMIETQNQLNDRVDGTFFTCQTAEDSPLPPPKDFQYEFQNSTHLKFIWIPYSSNSLKHAPSLSGYTIYWQADNKPFLPIFIPGAKTASHIIGGIRPEPLYQAYIVSRSSKFEDSIAKSPKLSIRMPPELISEFEEHEQAFSSSTRSPTRFSNFYRDPEITFTIYVIAGLTITVLLIIGITCCCYFCCLSFWKRRKQARLDALQRGHSNASSKISLDKDENAAKALIDVEAFEIPILQIPPDPPNFGENSDTKGPPGGPRPLGNRRFRQMMHDEQFKQQMHELNLDPTGFGICPGTRDECYRHIHAEEDRKFHELVRNERKDIEKRRIKGKRKKPSIASKFPNIAETSFISESGPSTQQLTPNPSIHNNDDAYSIGGNSQKYSASNQELNRSLGNLRNSDGLSPRSHSIAIYRRFFPRKRLASIIPDVKKALMIQPQSNHHHLHHQQQHLQLQQQQNHRNNYLICNELKPDSNLNHHHHQNYNNNNNRHPMNSPSSLPNLADSGIVFDDLSTSGGTTTSTLNPLSTQLPTILQGSCSGSITLVEDVLPKKSHSMLNQHLQDCRRERNSVLETSNTATLVP